MSEREWPAMTEDEWLDPTEENDEQRGYFLEQLGLLSDRKFRLLGCASVREVWDDLPHDELRNAILTCERFADGDATAGELRAASRASGNLYEGAGDSVADHSTLAIRDLCLPTPSFPMGEGSTAGMSAVVAELRYNKRTSWGVARKRARQFHCHLFRDIFGNPFRPVAFRPDWKTESVLLLARGIYVERAFDRLPILADALEEAGCDDPDVLNHCRGPGPHVRGCWVVDALLGKA